MNDDRHWAVIVSRALRAYPGPRRAAVLASMEQHFTGQANFTVMRAIHAYRALYARQPMAANDAS